MNTAIAADVRSVFVEYLRLVTTNRAGGLASLLYPIVGARVYAVDLPKGFTHALAAVVVRVQGEAEVGGSSVSRASFEVRCYGETPDPDSAVSVSLAVRRQIRVASDEHVTSGVLMSARIEGGSGELIWTPEKVRPWIPIFASAHIKP